MYYQIYLSSTNFGFFDFRDKNWKKIFIERTTNLIHDEIKFVDPLDVISDQAEIVDSDIRSILSSDFVVSYIGKKVTIGTVMEIMYTALYTKFVEIQIPIILIDKYKIHRKHPWIKKWVNHIVDDEEQAAFLVKDYYIKKGNKKSENSYCTL